MRGKKVPSNVITTTFTTTAVNAYARLQFQSVNSRPFIILPKYIPQENQWDSEQREKTSRKAGTLHQQHMKINIFIHTTS